jgi:hypothetical protein
MLQPSVMGREQQSRLQTPLRHHSPRICSSHFRMAQQIHPQVPMQRALGASCLRMRHRMQGGQAAGSSGPSFCACTDASEGETKKTPSRSARRKKLKRQLRREGVLPSARSSRARDKRWAAKSLSCCASIPSRLHCR